MAPKVTQPQRKYGWRGRCSKFAVGQRVRIGRPDSDLIGVVIEYGTPPKTIAHYRDLIHVQIVASDSVRYLVGYTAYWNDYQLHEE